MKRSSFRRKSYEEVMEGLKARQKSKKPVLAKLKRGSMVCPIPPEMREEMSQDPFYKNCAITGSNINLNWHHNLEFKGKRVNEKFAIIPLNKWVHDNISQFKEKVDWIMWNRASKEQIEYYSKAENYKLKLQRLNKIYGKYHIKR